MYKIAVTGSSGFVGKHLVNALNSVGHEVIELDIANGNDLTNPGCLKLLPKVDWIIHLASRSFVPQSFEKPYLFYNDNYLSTLQVLEKARKSDSKVIYFSSYLYGNPLYLPINEEHPLDPHNPYAQTKLIGEKLCEGYCRDFQVPVTVFRPFNIYGYGQNTSFLIPKIIEQLQIGDVQLQDSHPRRDFIHVNDVVSAIMSAIKRNSDSYDIFNLGYGKSVSVFEITKIISDLIATDNKITFTEVKRQNEVLDTVADIRKASTLLQWKPEIDIFEGLKRIINS